MVSAVLRNCPEINRLRATVKKTLQEIKFLQLKYNGAAVPSMSLDLDLDNSSIKKLLNMDEDKGIWQTMLVQKGG